MVAESFASEELSVGARSLGVFFVVALNALAD